MLRKIKYISLAIMFTIFTFLLVAYRSDSTTASNITSKLSYFSKHVKFTETYIDDNKETIQLGYEVWFNNVGEFRFNVVSGPFKGDYQVWDGQKLYQYTLLTNEMIVRDFINNEANGVVIPHEIFSVNLIESIKEIVNNGKFNNVNNNTYIYNGANGEKVEYELNNEHNMIISSTLYLGNNILKSRKVEIFDNVGYFDPELLKVDLSNVNIITMK